MARAWWRHQMETFFALVALCEGSSPISGEFPSQKPVTRSFHVFFDLHLNKRLSKQSRRWWFEMPLRSLWRHCNGAPRTAPDMVLATARTWWRHGRKKPFHISTPFVRGIHRSLKRPIMRIFDIFFVASLNKLLNKHATYMTSVAIIFAKVMAPVFCRQTWF